MNKHLKSIWWVHLPSLCAVVAMIAIMFYRRPWPANAPVHFNFHWQPDRWGSPWQFAVFPVLAFGIMVSGIMASAIWSRQERGQKRFNLVLPLLVAPLGLIAGIHWWYWFNLSLLSRTGHAPGAWACAIGFAVVVCVASIVLEIVRAPAPFSEVEDHIQISPAEIEADREFQRQLPPDGRWTYFESPSTGALPWILATSAFITLGAGFSFLRRSQFHTPGYILISICGLMIVFMVLFGSLRLRVNAHRLLLLGGIVRIPLLRLKLSDITEINVITFNPLKDFGGWGIRFAGNTRAYVFGGNRGVRLLARNGRAYLVSTRDPEKLAAALRAGVTQSDKGH